MLKQRLITGLLLLAAILAALFLASPFVFSILIALALGVGAWEWAGFMGLQNLIARTCYAGLVIGLLGLVLVIQPDIVSWLALRDNLGLPHLSMYVAGLWWLIALVLIINYPKSGRYWHSHPMISGLIGLVVLVPGWMAIVGLRGVSYPEAEYLGSYFLLYVMAIIWVADIGAYFSGKRFGKHKLAANVSPGKTWEGALGGLVLSLIFAYLGAMQFDFLASKPWLMLPLAFVVVSFSIVGDLTESIFKRERGLKDSGRCLPGHGGILDRIDSLTAACPIFVLLIAELELLP